MAWSNIIRQTAAEWTAQNPILVDNYSGYETDTGKMKAGDGVTTWNSLAYLSPNAGMYWWVGRKKNG